MTTGPDQDNRTARALALRRTPQGMNAAWCDGEALRVKPIVGRQGVPTIRLAIEIGGGP